MPTGSPARGWKSDVRYDDPNFFFFIIRPTFFIKRRLVPSDVPSQGSVGGARAVGTRGVVDMSSIAQLVRLCHFTRLNPLVFPPPRPWSHRSRCPPNVVTALANTPRQQQNFTGERVRFER